MASNNLCKIGQSFTWNVKPECDINYALNSSEFEIIGTKLKWMLSITTCYKYEEYYLSIKLVKCQYNISYRNVINIVTIVHNLEKLACSEVKISYPYHRTYEILFVKQLTPIESIKITCAFSQSLYAKYEKSTQVSDECFEQQTICKIPDIKFSFTPPPPVLDPIIHLKSLSEDFHEMLQKNIRTDIELKCGEVSIPAHKAVLMSRSNVFSSMFKCEMVENITDSVDIQDMELSILQEFLKYMYSGKISDDLSLETIQELYKASDKYEVKWLQEGCRNMLVRMLTEENCFDILMLAEKHCDEELRDTIADFIIERPDVLKSDAWFEFSDNFSKLANLIYKKYVEKTT